MISTLRRLQRFFEPTKLLGWKAIPFASVVVLWRLYDLGLTVLMREITNSFQSANIEHIHTLLFIGGGGWIVYHTVLYFTQQQALYSSIEMQQAISNKYFKQIFEKQHLYRENQGTGKMISYIKEGITWRAEFNVTFVHRTIGITMSVISALIIMKNDGIRYFLGLLIALIIATQVSMYFRTKASIFRKQKYEARAGSTRQLVKMIMSRNDIIYNDQSCTAIKNFHNNLSEERYRGEKQRPYEHIGFTITTSTIDIARIAILVALGYQLLGGGIGFGDLLASTAIITLLAKGINDYIDSLRQYMINGISIERFRSILDDTPSILGYDTGKDFHYQSGTIVFNKVSFAYGEKEVMTDCSLTIPGGKKVALVGHSGGGKTTIAKLIAGYLHPSSGSLLVDGQQLPTSHSSHHTINLKSYYCHIAYLTQEPSVFDGTILENLTFGLNIDNHAELSELADIIDKAQCQFIYDFPQGLDTEIGEKGIKLSGGQRQRLAIARVFLKNPEIIILDEPTSALDSVAEHEITKAMHNLFVGRTVIIIAHRLQTVKDADIIVMVEQGHITAQGTHSELLQTNTHYQELVSLQSGW